MTASPNVRIERDSMGEMEVPADALYGASTMRAVLNFPISSLRFPRTFIRALGLIKQSAARSNMSLGLLDERIGNAIVAAAQEVIDGQLDRHFVLDIFQTGSGTSTNTNANEVIANRASQLLGGDLGSRLVHPNDHVNMGQSSNDVIPTSIHSGRPAGHQGRPDPRTGKPGDGAGEEVRGVLAHHQDRTHPLAGRHARAARSGVPGLRRTGPLQRPADAAAQEALAEVALGGTAVGTGVNTHPEFSARTCAYVSEAAGVEIRETGNHFQAQSSLDALVEASGELKTVAISLHKIANDIRFIASGPRAGLGEISLPEVQPGSSIMPGKINPVIAESVVQVVAQVVGNDAAVTLAGQGGYFELNTMMPVAAHNILESISLLAASANNFADQCVEGIEATTVGPDMVEKGLMLGHGPGPGHRLRRCCLHRQGSRRHRRHHPRDG